VVVSPSNEIIKKARELEMMRRLEEKGKVVPKSQIQEVLKKIQVLEMKIDLINKKIDKLLERKKQLEVKDVHKRILNLMDTWVNTESLSKALGYSHEYVSRMVSELKEMGKIEEKRTGKYLFYRRK